MRERAVTLKVALGIVGTGAGILLIVWAIRLSMPEMAVAKEEVLPNVLVEVLESTTVEDRIILSGSTEAWEAVTVSAETNGKIEWQGIQEGDKVGSKQELIRINTTSVRARMAQAKAKDRLARQELERIERLHDEGISSPQELDRARANMDAATATLTLTEIELDQSVVSAEITGIVDKLFKEEGEFVTIGMPLLRLVQVDKVKILTAIPERDVAHFAVGDRVTVRIDAFPDRRFDAVIHRIATSAELATRTFPTELAVENASHLLKPGMMARAVLVRNEYRDAISIPLFSVITRGEDRLVFLEEEGHARERRVEVGFFEGEFIHVISGVQPGDRLIVAGHRDLRDGDRVRIHESAE